MTRRHQDTRLVHHLIQGNDLGAVVTALVMNMDGLAMDPASVNPVAPRAMRLRRITTHSFCVVVNSAGAWTLGIRLNESGSNTATFSVDMSAVPGTKQVGNPSAVVILQAGDTYHLVLSGPSRNIAAARITLEWEPI